MSRWINVCFILVTLASHGVAGQTTADPTTAAPTTAIPTPTATPIPIATPTPTATPTTATPTTATPTTATPTTATPTTATPTPTLTPTPTPPTQLVVTMYTTSSCTEEFPHSYPATTNQQCVPWGPIDPNNAWRPSNEVWGGLDVHCQPNGMFDAHLLQYNSSSVACGKAATSVGFITGSANNTCYFISTPTHGNQYFTVQCFSASQPSVSCPPITASANQSFVYPNGTLVRSLPSLPFASGFGEINIQCDNGTHLYGSPYITCDQHGWSTLPYCLQPGYCPPRSGPHRLYNLQSVARAPSIPSQPTGVVALVFCDDGWYIDTGVGTDVTNNPKSMTCQNGAWSITYPDCRAKIATIQCPIFVPPPHTVTRETSGTPMQQRMYDVGSQLRSSCYPNYTSSTGDEMITCQPNGKWDGPGVDDCKRTFCLPPPAPANGQFVPPPSSNIPVGTILQVKCNAGYKLIQSVGSQLLCDKKKDSDAQFYAPRVQCVADNAGLTGNPNDTSDNSYPKRVAGGVIGGILGFALVIICVYCCCAHRAKPAKFVSLGGEQHEKHTGDEMAQLAGPQVETAEEI